VPYDLSKVLVVGISSRALFDLEVEDDIYAEQGLEAYSAYQIEHENEPLAPGSGMQLVRALLRLNEIDPEVRRAEIVIMSRNNADTSLRIFNSIRHHGLDISRAALTSGAPLAGYSDAFKVDLFLSPDASDVQTAVDSGFAAAQIYTGTPDSELPSDQVRIAFDGDAVLFSAESERIYQEEGLEAFQAHERAMARQPMLDGPFAGFLRTLSRLQSDLKDVGDPIRTALITARNSPAHERVVHTLRAWGVRVDEAFFLGGASKDGVLRAFKPHIFFDDQPGHLEPSVDHTAVAQVPYRTTPETGQLILAGTPPREPRPKAKAKRAKPASVPNADTEPAPPPPKSLLEPAKRGKSKR